MLRAHIAEVFSVPTSQYVSHETKVWLPYVFKRHILRQRIPKPPSIIATADEAYGDVTPPRHEKA